MTHIPQITRAIECVCPDLAGMTLYVVPARSYGLANTGRYGHYHPDLTDRVKQRLIDDGRWNGPGPTIAIDETELSRIRDDRQRTHRVMGVCVHELAHWLDLPDMDAVRRRQAQGDERGCRWHGLRFTRACCHLVHRLHAAGADLPATAVSLTDPTYECYSPAQAYMQATSHESARCRHKPIREILNYVRPDDALLRLWASDVAARIGCDPAKVVRGGGLA